MGDHNQIATGLDRRTLIKRGAAAGAIAWTVPTILSSQAHALNGACTPGCAPNPVLNLNPATALYCVTPGGKWAELTLSWEAGPCPCATGGLAVYLGSSVTPNPSEVKTVTFDNAARTATIRIGGQGNGALGNGTYDAQIFFCIQCNDSTGDPISREIRVDITFTFQPADGNCSTAANVGPATLTNTVFGDPVCAPCVSPA